MKISGQALIELAVFGAIFLMILGALISYGLRYNFNQQAQMQAFRRALKIASDENHGDASYMLIQDKHVPDPSDVFGAGSGMPVVASASVTRTYQLDAQADDISSLPSTVVDIQTSQDNGVAAPMRRIIYKNSGFRIEHNVPKDSIKKYTLLYGSNVLGLKGGVWGKTDDADTTTTGGVIKINAVRIEDPCVAEVTDYESCYELARVIVNAAACTTRCDQTTDASASGLVCSTECDKLTNPPNQNDSSYNSASGGAWYAANWSPDGHGGYIFPELDKLFAFAQSSGPVVKTMGLQQDTTTNTVRSNSIRKIESSGGDGAIQTVESANWSDVTSRLFVHNRNLNATGYDTTNIGNPAANLVNETIESRVSGNVSQVWTTKK